MVINMFSLPVLTDKDLQGALSRCIKASRDGVSQIIFLSTFTLIICHSQCTWKASDSSESNRDTEWLGLFAETWSCRTGLTFKDAFSGSMWLSQWTETLPNICVGVNSGSLLQRAKRLLEKIHPRQQYEEMGMVRSHNEMPAFIYLLLYLPRWFICSENQCSVVNYSFVESTQEYSGQ